MKLQSIFIFVTIFISNTKAGKLEPNENEARLEKCGTVEEATFGYGTAGFTVSTATLISSRHALMSADILLKSDMTYYHNGKRFDNSKCNDGEHVHVKVDPAIYPSISLSWEFTSPRQSSKKQRVKVIDAHIICSKDTFGQGSNFFFPMFVEFTPGTQLKLPCLWDSNEELLHRNDKEDLYVFTRNSIRDSKKYDAVKFVDFRFIDWLYFINTDFPNSAERGAAIFKAPEKKWVLVGIGAGVHKGENWFYNIRWIEMDVCQLTGVCRTLKAPETTITEEPSTEEPTTEVPTTEEPTTEKPTTEEPTTEKPTTEEILIKASEIGELTTEKPSIAVEPEKPTNPPVSMTTSEIHEPPTTKESPSPEPTMEPIPMIDLDQEYKEFKEREAEDDKGDWDEWENPSNIFSWAQNETPKEYIKTAALISSRHILMSSRVVLREGKWAHNNQDADLKNCSNNENGYIHVPRDSLDTVSTGWTSSFEQKIFTRAVIICNTDTYKRMMIDPLMSFPMIVEISRSFDSHVTFCLPSEDYQLRMNKDHVFWQYTEAGFGNDTLQILPLSAKASGFFEAGKYEQNTDGILTDNKTLVGLGVNPENEMQNSEFLNVQFYTKDFCVLFGICNERSGQLTKEENDERLEHCGSSIYTNVLSHVKFGKSCSMMTFISSRHVLTTADILLDTNRITLNKKDCEPNITSIQVPLEAFSGLEFSWKETVKVENAYIICDWHFFKTRTLHGLPMVLEISPNFAGDKPCLPDQTTKIQNKDNLRLYQLAGKYFSTNLTLKSYSDQFRVFTVKETLVEKTSKSGNPLLKNIITKERIEKRTLVGVSTKLNGEFFTVRWISQKICDLTGICPQPPTSTVAPPTTEAPTTVPTTPPTTEAPTTEKVEEPTTDSEYITTPTITDSFTTKESPSPEATMEPIPVIDLDQEYKEFKEREAEDDKGDWDEWGNDFYRSADFFESSGRRSELFVDFLMVAVIKLLIFILYLVIGSSKGKSLTTDENKRRLGRCGKFVGQKFSKIFSWAQSYTPNTAVKTAALISSRHILMSSRGVLHKRNWAHNGEAFDEKNCTNNENGYIHVPKEALAPNVMGTGWTNSFTRAVIICNKETFKLVDESLMTFPMIVEISPEIKDFEKHVTFCLPSEDYQLRMNEPHDFYQYKIKETVPSKLNILSPGVPEFFYAEKYEKNTDGILTDNTHLVGLGVNPGDGSKNSEFHKVQLYTKDFCVLFGICNERTGKLTKEENDERLGNCGDPRSSLDNFGSVTNGKVGSEVTMISSRHALMTANVLLNKIFITANEGVCLGERIRYFQVPVDAFSWLKFSWKEAVTIKDAYIICDKRTFKNWGNGYNLPMIIEISPHFPGNKPCLPDGTQLNNDDVLFKYKNSQIGTTSVKSVGLRYIETKKTDTESGNPLFKVIYTQETRKDNYTLVGVNTGEKNFYFSVQWMLPCICELTGICQPPPPPTVPPTIEAPTTVPTAPPTTEAPTTDKVEELTTDSENTTTPTIPDPSTTKESTPPEPTMEPIRVIDLDQEYKEFKEREAEDDRGDWDEWGNDFYRSADFFSSGRRIELFVGFLVVIMVVWRMILG
ncbi:unnamed protein product [Caenorhabditis brenneri]